MRKITIVNPSNGTTIKVEYCRPYITTNFDFDVRLSDDGARLEGMCDAVWEANDRWLSESIYNLVEANGGGALELDVSFLRELIDHACYMAEKEALA